MLLSSIYSQAQYYREDNGFGLKVHVCVPTSGYSCDEELDRVYRGVSFGVQIDNRWYFWHDNRYEKAIAFNAHWLDFTLGKGDITGTEIQLADESDENSKTEIVENVTKSATHTEIGLLGIGLIYTGYLEGNRAIDVFYNIDPTLALVSGGPFNDEYNCAGYPDKHPHYLGAGFTHNIGAAFRWSEIFQTGIEFRYGHIFSNGASSNSIKAFFGFKF